MISKHRARRWLAPTDSLPRQFGTRRPRAHSGLKPYGAPGSGAQHGGRERAGRRSLIDVE